MLPVVLVTVAMAGHVMDLLGRELGVATPTADLVYAALLPLERRARGELGFA